MVTPLEDHDTLDVAGLERLVEHILAGGPAGLFILGTTGEGPSLGYKLKQELVDRVAEQVAGRVPLLVGITDPSYVETVNFAEHAADSGAQAVVLAPPFYFPCGQDELTKYVEHVVAALPLPAFLYNIPALTKVAFGLQTVRRAMDLPGVVGMKDSSADMIHFHKLRRLTATRPDFSLLIGPEELLAEAMLFGADGGVSGGANLYPELYVDLFEAAARRDLNRLDHLHAQVMEISSRIYTVAKQGPGVLKGLKCALSLLGICRDVMAEPFGPLPDNERRAVERHLRELGLFEKLAAVRGRESRVQSPGPE
jgi:4-hydroxy-tetrahydrodipicolinate synthase